MNLKRNHIIIILVISSCSYFVFELFSENNQRKYASEIIKMRAEKDIFFRSSDESPISEQSSFKELEYFPVNPAFRFNGTYLADSNSGKEIKIKMSDGVYERFIHSGSITFTKDKMEYQLISFRNRDDSFTKRLFVPFTDSTSGVSTYGGGRYLDLDLRDNNVIIDFNLAYHPYCLYNDNYICPIPPPENHIPFAITAGEKLP